MGSVLLPPFAGLIMGSAAAGLQYVGGMTGTGAANDRDVTFSLTSLTGGIASQPAEDDIVIVAGQLEQGANRAVAITGYDLSLDLYSSDSYRTNMTVGYKVMGATPDTSFEVTSSGISSNNAWAVCAQVWRGVDTVTPMDVTQVTSDGNNNSGIPNPPSITPVTAGAIIIAMGASGSQNTTLFTNSELSNFLAVSVDPNRASNVGMGS